MAYQSVNPYDGKILKTFEELSDRQLETALEAAATCFKTWRHTTFAERAAVVAKAAAIMRARLVMASSPKQRLGNNCASTSLRQQRSISKTAPCIPG